jgi:hypothetical protein
MAIPQDQSDFFERGHNPVKGKVAVRGLSADGTVTLPKYAMVDRVIIRNRTANAVTGGVDVGTTAGGGEIVAALAVGANAVARKNVVSENGLGFSKSAGVPLYITAVTAWASAVLDVIVEYSLYPVY